MGVSISKIRQFRLGKAVTAIRTNVQLAERGQDICTFHRDIKRGMVRLAPKQRAYILKHVEDLERARKKSMESPSQRLGRTPVQSALTPLFDFYRTERRAGNLAGIPLSEAKQELQNDIDALEASISSPDSTQKEPLISDAPQLGR